MAFKISCRMCAVRLAPLWEWLPDSPLLMHSTHVFKTVAQSCQHVLLHQRMGLRATAGVMFGA